MMIELRFVDCVRKAGEARPFLLVVHEILRFARNS